MNMRLLGLPIIVVLIILLGYTDARRLTNDEVRQIEDRIDGFVKAGVLPGMSLAVVSDQGVELARGYGTADIERGVPVTNKTKFYLASTSKAFTGVLVAKLIGAHPTYSLDTKVKDILGDQFHLSELYRTKHANFIDLLSHRVGTHPNNFVWMLNNIVKREEYIRTLYLFPVQEGFRTSMVYSNSMYAVAGYALRQIYNKTWEDLMRDEILTPLNMSDSTTFYAMTEAEIDRMAKPYLAVNGTFKRVEWEAFKGGVVSAAAGAIVSTAEDMCKWLLFHIREGKNEDGIQVVPKADLDYTYVPQNVAQWRGSFTLNRYSLGWYNGYYKGYQVLRHSGFLNEFQSQVTLILNAGLDGKKIGIYTSWNGEGGASAANVTSLHMLIIDLLLGPDAMMTKANSRHVDNNLLASEKEEISPEDFPPFSNQLRKTRNSTGLQDLQDYVGVYGHFGYGNMTFVMNSTSQQLEGRYGEAEGVVYSTDVPDVFMIKLRGIFWYLPENPVIFSSSTGSIIDTLTVPVFNAKFKRNLKLADAPPPPEDNCP